MNGIELDQILSAKGLDDEQGAEIFGTSVLFLRKTRKKEALIPWDLRLTAEAIRDGKNLDALLKIAPSRDRLREMVADSGLSQVQIGKLAGLNRAERIGRILHGHEVTRRSHVIAMSRLLGPIIAKREGEQQSAQEPVSEAAASALAEADAALPSPQRALVEIGRCNVSKKTISAAMLVALDASDGGWVVYAQSIGYGRGAPGCPRGCVKAVALALCNEGGTGDPVCVIAQRLVKLDGKLRLWQYLIRRRQGKAARRDAA